MTILSLDTTTPAGSRALIIDGRVIDERRGDATRTHAERLPRELIELAEDNGTSLAAIDLFAVASGPGSFTGLRIGIATIQGAALVHHRRVVPISALEAIAHVAAANAAPDETIGAWMNAQRGEVFAALYRVTTAPPFDPDRLREIEPATVAAPETVIADWTRSGYRPALIAGDGTTAYDDAIRGLSPHIGVEASALLAGAIGRLAHTRALRGQAIPPAAIQPVYVRRPDAELDREKRARGYRP